jgi:F-type H+-transporting ATPase subunit a
MIEFYSGLSSAIKGSIIIFVILTISTFWIGIKAKDLDPNKTPKGIMFISVLFVETVNNMIRPMFPKHFNKFAAFLMTLFLYLLFANTSSLFGLTAPLSNLNVAISMSIIVFGTIQVSAMIIKKPKRRMEDLMAPNPVFLPLNLIGEITTPFSMGMRLFGNLLSGSILAILVYHFTSYFGVIVGAFLLHPIFDIFFGAIQAYVFFNLFTIFLSIAVED